MRNIEAAAHTLANIPAESQTNRWNVRKTDGHSFKRTIFLTEYYNL